MKAWRDWISSLSREGHTTHLAVIPENGLLFQEASSERAACLVEEVVDGEALLLSAQALDERGMRHGGVDVEAVQGVLQCQDNKQAPRGQSSCNGRAPAERTVGWEGWAHPPGTDLVRGRR